MAIIVAGLWDYRFSSLGAQALSEGLHHTVETTFPNQRVDVLPNEALFRGYGTLMELAGRIRPSYRPCYEIFYKIFRRRFAGHCRAIAAADLLVVSGDGIVADMFMPHTVMLAFHMRAAREAGTPVISLNQSINVSSGSLAAFCVQDEFLRHPLSVRETDSEALMRNQFGRDVPVSLDAAFLVPTLDAEERTLFDRRLTRLKQRHGIEAYVMVGVRANRPRSQHIDIEAWRQVIQATAEAFARPVVLASTAPDLDIPLAHVLADGCNDVCIMPELMDSSQYHYRFFIHMLGQAHACVTDRYHQNVFAALAGTPFIPVEGNTSKTSGLLSLLSHETGLLSLPTKANQHLYRQALRHMATHHARIKADLPQQVAKAIARYNRYASLLRAAIKG